MMKPLQMLSKKGKQFNSSGIMFLITKYFNMCKLYVLLLTDLLLEM